MRRTPLVAVPVALLVLLTGCGSGDGPRPGLAAQVDGQRLSESRLDHLVDALCIVRTDDPNGQAAARSTVVDDQLTGWIYNTALLEYADEHDLTAAASPQDLTEVPGWERMSDAEREALQDLAEQQTQAKAIQDAHPDLQLRASDFDIVINPRYGIDLSDRGFAHADKGLSVAVSDEATSSGSSDQSLQDLPPGQVCGKVPAGGAG